MEKSLTKEEKLITALVLQRVSDHLELEDDGKVRDDECIAFQMSVDDYGTLVSVLSKLSNDLSKI